MSRLFITEREQQFINDLTKEFVKDVVGQYIVYYPVSTMKTNVDVIYDEAVEKIFNNPIKIDALVGQVERENTFDKFGVYQNKGSLEVFIQYRDLLDKNLSLSIGDFFVYGNHTYEVQDLIQQKNIFGQEDHYVNWLIKANMVMASQFDINVFNKLIADSRFFKDKLGNKSFEQQRGLAETEAQGETGDVRQIRERLGEQMVPIALNEGPRKVIPDSQQSVLERDASIKAEEGNSFYDE